MFGIIFFIFIIFIILKANNTASNFNIYPKLAIALKNQHYTNIKFLSRTSYITMLTAELDGDVSLFAFKNNTMQFNVNEITSVYETANKSNIHNIVVIHSYNTKLPSMVMQKVIDYNIEVWDINKLNSLNGFVNITNTTSHSNNNAHYTNIPKTTINNTQKYATTVSKRAAFNTSSSDDSSSYNPIQEDTDKKGSLFGNLFKKPDRL